ncbi:MAG: peptide chain release factor N(5)-glutamine methyltransferase [Chitinophagales bacterium]|nr:peptide chain release factor N(5)-glutamine methyltransferase [Chitinophagales bacterium]MDW8393411.1 peptide chain release factor N(5)-glutamine methyltransferase [Chitinophagales bacterium]
MTAAEVFHSLRRQLQDLYPDGEAEAVSRLVVEAVSGIESFVLSLHGGYSLERHQADAAVKALLRLQKGEPVQYVIGYAHFDGLKLRVSPAVLIPRPETEELVQWVADELSRIPAARVLDAGTGSGCIALALKRRLPRLHLFAVDISEAALTVARSNADAMGLDITFSCHDLLSPAIPFEGLRFDCVVCNPPYVLPEEQQTLAAQVVQFEPHRALFAPDADPLRFYRHLTDRFYRNQQKPAILFFEINPKMHEKLSHWLETEGLAHQFRTDWSGHVRMLRIGGN